ncbi:hypothetical protein BLL37_14090 [Pseudomonas azotoformans]|uniref:Uncharacterized protein n=1 Tax=Pseudomonas azotoformans TaxID=47878 RepID=A0A1V2JGQ7_PSEAZ|nr:hypothetical protein [Pseudomonas azotoformans]OIN51783.1 hypothetical protein BFL39_05425 [Pseudomonas azotoformans]ONH44459.1 hypothetical protein BLL37_14090 [Pseudomonas azotoformans]SDN27784.1 hypothetical protein SAMN04489799_1565 [Pseudomonas azotoformans]
MAITLNVSYPPLSKQTDAYTIKNPQQVTNAFTITEASEAADTLKLGDQEKISQLKEFLKDYDMTSISTDELKKVGRRLYDDGMISQRAFGMFISGDGASDANGRQTNTHVKFNAIALFNEKLEDTRAFFKSEPMVAMQDGAMDHLQGMVSANQAVGALAYFVKSANNDLSINEYA